MESCFPMVLKGKVVSGLGEGRFFTELPWARKQFMDKLGIDPYPGTLNLKLDNPQILRQWEKVKSLPGIMIAPPPKEGFCNGRCFSILIEGRVRGAIVFPEVPGYPAEKLEIIAACNLKEVLDIKDGVEIRIDVMG